MSDTSSAARTGYIDPMEMVLGDAEARLAAVKASYERENAALRARVVELEAERDAALHNEAVAMDSEAKLLDRLATPAAPSEPVAWAAVKDGGTVGDGRIWRHRDKAERFVANMGSYAMQQPRLGYEIVPLYARPAAREGVTEAMVARINDSVLVPMGYDPWAQMNDEGRREAVECVRAIAAALHAGRAKHRGTLTHGDVDHVDS